MTCVARPAEAMAREHLRHGAEDALAAAPVPLLVALDERQEVLSAPEEAENHGDDLPQDLARGRVGRGRGLELDRDALETGLERAAMEVVLRREVEIHGALADACARRDLAHQHLVEVALREDGGRRRKDPLSLVAVAHVMRTRRSELTGQFCCTSATRPKEEPSHPPQRVP